MHLYFENVPGMCSGFLKRLVSPLGAEEFRYPSGIGKSISRMRLASPYLMAGDTSVSINLTERAVEGCACERANIGISDNRDPSCRMGIPDATRSSRRRLTAFDDLRLSEVAFQRCLSRKPIIMRFERRHDRARIVARAYRPAVRNVRV